MTTIKVQVGSTITNGSSCIRVTERIEKDPRWRAPAWRGVSIPLEEFGGNRGMTTSVPDYLLSGWYDLPFEWRLLPGMRQVERYVWADGYRYLRREVTKLRHAPGDTGPVCGQAPFTFPGDIAVTTDQAVTCPACAYLGGVAS